jgi:undecaprenyl diphosphate synthase
MQKDAVNLAAAPDGAGEQQLPRHVAVIMDGNGRWATQRSLPRTEGHRHGVEAVRRLVRVAIEAGTEYLTIFTFSSENWRRPRSEISYLFSLAAALHSPGCGRIAQCRCSYPGYWRA